LCKGDVALRPLEASLLVLLALFAATWFVRVATRQWWIQVAAAVVLLALGVHLAIEGYRWPMVPAYILAAVLTLRAIWACLRGRSSATAKTGRGKTWRRVLAGGTWLLLTAIAAAVPTLFPHLRLPEPTGPYSVGTTDLFLVDQDRLETFTSDPDDRREIAARIWYPAESVANAVPVAYMENAAEVSHALTRFTPFPPFLFAHLGRVPTHACRDAPVLQRGSPWPLVIFNHAYWAGIPQSTALMEELASNGYVAVSVGHAFETPYFVRPDGSVHAFDPHNAEFAERARERNDAYEIQQQLTMTRDVRKLEELIRELSRRRPKAVESLHIWVADISAVLTELERRNAGGGPFAGRLDTDRVAVIGHSFGGAAAGQACLDDPRCKAGISLDGLLIGDMLDRPLETPFLFFHHDNVGAENRAPNLPFFERARAPAYLAIIAGTGHLSFSDVCLYPRTSLFRLALPAGGLDGRRCQTIVNAYVLAFLDRHLKGQDTAPLESLSEHFPEVELRTRPSTLPE
jgi:predicted dienelactone hydrolase